MFARPFLAFVRRTLEKGGARRAPDEPKQEKPKTPLLFEPETVTVLDRLGQRLLLSGQERRAFIGRLSLVLQNRPLPERRRLTQLVVRVLRLQGSSDIRPERSRVFVSSLLTLLAGREGTDAPLDETAAFVRGKELFSSLFDGPEGVSSYRDAVLLTVFDRLALMGSCRVTNEPLKRKNAGPQNASKVLAAAFSSDGLLAGRLILFSLLSAPRPESHLAAVGLDSFGNQPSGGIFGPEAALYLPAGEIEPLLTKAVKEIVCGLLTDEKKGGSSAASVSRLVKLLAGDSPGSTFARLTRAGLVAAPLTALFYGEDGLARRQRIWSLTPAVVSILARMWSPEQLRALAKVSYEMLQTELDRDLARGLALTPLGTNPYASDVPTELLSVLGGTVAVPGLSSWAQAVLADTLGNLDAAVRQSPAEANFYGVGLTRFRSRDLQYGKDPGKDESDKEEMSEHARKALDDLEKLPSQYEAARATTRTSSAKASALGSVPAPDSVMGRTQPPTALFIPCGEFATPPEHWIGPLAALGLAAGGAGAEPLYRFRAGAAKPVEGVLFAFFESAESGRFWSRGIFGARHKKAGPLTRRTLLKRFLRMDAMQRSLTTLSEDFDSAQKERNAGVLMEGGTLGKAALGEAACTALSRFVSGSDMRILGKASAAELAHAFLTLRHRKTAPEGPIVKPTGLENFLAAAKATHISKSGRRMQRLQAASDDTTEKKR